MGKNRKFKNSYIITVEGKTTNGFSALVFDKLIRVVAEGLVSGSRQVSTSIKVVSTEGDFDAKSQITRKDEQ